jgi:alpha-amylase
LNQFIVLSCLTLAYSRSSSGIPIVYEGQEQHYSGGDVPYNREAIWLSGYSTTATLYTWITKLNQIRNVAIAANVDYLDYQAWPIYSDSSNIAMRKGYAGSQIVGVFSNVGSSGSASISLTASNTGFTAGQVLTDVMSCTNFTADSSGNLAVTISSGIPRVFYPAAALSKTSVCSSSPSTTTTTTMTTSTSKLDLP